MAVLALSALGAAAGGAIGGTFLGVTAASWGWMAGSMLGNALFAEDVQGPRLGDLRVTGSEYGQTIPWVAGSPRIAGQIVWASNKRETANTQSAKGGPEQTTYTYDCDLLIILTEEEITGVSRIWSNSELVYDGATTKNGIWSNLEIYTGSDDQMPDPTYEAAVGVGNAPAYRGRGYVVISGLQLGGSGQIPNLTFEIAWSRQYAPSNLFYAPMTADQYDTVDPVYPPTSTSILGSGVSVSFGVGGARFYRSIDTANISASVSWSQVSPPANIKTNMNAYYGIANAFGWGFTLTEFVPSGDTTYPGIFCTIAQYSGTFFTNDHIYVAVKQADGTWQLRLYIGQSYYTYNEMIPLGDAAGLVGSVFRAVRDFVNGGVRFFINDVLVHISSYTSVDIYNSLVVGMGQDGVATAAARVLSVGIKDVVMFVNTTPEPYIILTKPPVSEAIDSLMVRAGYGVLDFGIDGFSEDRVLRALAIGSISSTRTTLDMLKSAYFFEASKSDKIYIRPRAETAVVTIPWADLGCAADPETGEDALSLVLANDLEIPAQVALSYPSMEQDYQTATEHSDRIFSGQESTQTIQLGIGMTSAEAKGVADAIVFDLAASQTKTTLRVPLKYAYVEPGDIVNAVNFDGRTYRLRVQTKRDTLSIIELECVLDDVGALQSASITDGDYISVTEPVTVEQTEFEALDIPILRDADNSPGYYMAVGPVITTPDNYEWKGAQVVRSWNGTDYAELFQTTGAGVLGTCSNTLGNWTGGNVYDETNTLTVVTTGGELSSRTREAMQLDGTLNVAAVGSQSNGWEIIRFRNATLTGTNTYVLTGLHRGFRGTEWAIGGHGAGEQFVLLDSALRRVTTQTSQIGLLRYIKAATFGLRLADVTAENFTDTGVALKPFAPVNPVALSDGADVMVSWQRRTRVSYVYGGATPSVPVGESLESYRVRIFDGSTLVRTEVVLSPEYTYAAADISSDGFASSDTITFEICQISEIVGAGYPAECEGIAP